MPFSRFLRSSAITKRSQNDFVAAAGKFTNAAGGPGVRARIPGAGGLSIVLLCRVETRPPRRRRPMSNPFAHSNAYASPPGNGHAGRGASGALLVRAVCSPDAAGKVTRLVVASPFSLVQQAAVGPGQDALETLRTHACRRARARERGGAGEDTQG